MEIIKIISYLGLITASVVGMVVFDEDARSVSLYEWIFLAVLVYSAVNLVQLLFRLYREEKGS